MEAVVAKFVTRKSWAGVVPRATTVAVVLAILPVCISAQENRAASSSSDSVTAASSNVNQPASVADVHALTETVSELQAEIHALNAQINDLRAAQSRSDEEIGALKEQLHANGTSGTSNANAAASIAAAPSDSTDSQQSYATPQSPDVTVTPMNSSAAAPVEQNLSLQDRVTQLEEDDQLLNSKLVEQSQTKVESGSKYRVRLSGLILFNTFENRGTVDNIDFPQLALETDQPFSSSSFGASLRQSQIGIEAFGPNVGGARTSASIDFDFAGGFPQDTTNGETMGIVRMRTAFVRFDWTNTSIVVGQDHLFFVPLSPTSLSMQAVPALSYAGNLWSWTPQVRIEHKIPLSDQSSVLLQAGFLDSLTGDWPAPGSSAYPSWGEQSGQPGYAARVAWTHALNGQDLTLGAGGYYGRQWWGYGRHVDGWAGTLDVAIPLNRVFSLTGAYYRGRAVGGMWGALDQDVLMSGSLFDPGTVVKGLDSEGGWMQLKFRPRANFQINAAYGEDNPFASELDRFPDGQSSYGYSFTRNQSPFVNFIYQVRSDVEFSVEYRRLRTMVLDDDTQTANRYDASIGYKF
jgi:hypothetical protein